MLQREVLDRKWFSSLDEAEVALGRFADYYNFRRLSGTLGWQTAMTWRSGTCFLRVSTRTSSRSLRRT